MVVEVRHKLCIFCGSRFGADPSFKTLAQSLGQGLAKRGYGCVYGGGNVGLMGTIASSVMQAGGKVDGFIPQKLMDIEVGKHDITELVVTSDMFTRKQIMIERSDAFIALPGGLGTLDEILDAITLKQLKYHNKPVLLLGPDGFWSRFDQLIKDVVQHGFASGSALSLYQICEDETSLWKALEEALPC